MAPSPVLTDDDPVLATILSLGGFVVNGQQLLASEGLTVAEAKRAAYLTRGDMVEAQGMLDDYVVRSQMDGWPLDTELRFEDDGELILTVAEQSQPAYGTWVLDPSEPDHYDDVQIRGYSYDMYAAAATLTELLASRLKLQFNFSDGSGTYGRDQKYQMALQNARLLWAKARIGTVEMVRHDYGNAEGFGDFFFAQNLAGGWA